MTSKLFEKYVQLLDHHFTVGGRKTVMVVDNAPAHLEIENLSAMELEVVVYEHNGAVRALGPGGYSVCVASAPKKHPVQNASHHGKQQDIQHLHAQHHPFAGIFVAAKREAFMSQRMRHSQKLNC